jgi:hypothetical protein
MKFKVLILLGLFSLSFCLTFFGQLQAKNVNKEVTVLNQLVVRMPTPVLCPSQTKYRTDCVGEGMGCDMTQCDTPNIH